MTRATIPLMAANKPRRNPSGTQWGDEQYAEAGYGRLGLRMLAGDLKRLASLAKQAGVTRSALLAQWIQEAWDRRNSR